MSGESKVGARGHLSPDKIERERGDTSVNADNTLRTRFHVM